MATVMQRRTFLAGFGLTTLSACGLSAPDSLVAEGEQRPPVGGVGGTGIIGTVHGADGLSVNGLSIALEPGATLHGALGVRPPSGLGEGHSVTLIAAGTDGGLRTASVGLTQPLIGPLESVTDGGRLLRCLGVSVLVEPNAPLIGPDGRPFRPRVGLRVAISGVWRGDMVIASRIELLAPRGPMVMAGVVRRDRNGRLRLGALSLVLPSAMPRPETGSFATAIGQRSGSLFIAERFVPGRFAGLSAPAPLKRLSVEGYLEATAAAPGFTISGLGHSFDAEAKVASLTGDRALFVGPYDGDFRVAYGLPLPEDVARRATLMASLPPGQVPEGAVLTR